LCLVYVCLNRRVLTCLSGIASWRINRSLRLITKRLVCSLILRSVLQSNITSRSLCIVRSLILCWAIYCSVLTQVCSWVVLRNIKGLIWSLICLGTILGLIRSRCICCLILQYRNVLTWICVLKSAVLS
jgi:hypothetical protein